MAKYRKKPVVIDAFRWIGDADRPAWFCDAVEDERVKFIWDQVRIYTLEGVMTASPGDWIIKGISGELYPCKHEIFEQTYELED